MLQLAILMKYIKYLPYVLIAVLIVILSLLFNAYKAEKSNRVIAERNYISSVEQTTWWVTAWKTQAARTGQIVLTKDQMIQSKDANIQDLVKVNKKLGGKIKDLEYALRVNVHSTVDTTYITEFVGENETIVVERDSLVIGKLFIRRLKVQGTNVAKYHVEYDPTLYIYFTKHKDGKWKLKNLFVPRETVYTADVTSDDQFINIKNLTLIKQK